MATSRTGVAMVANVVAGDRLLTPYSATRVWKFSTQAKTVSVSPKPNVSSGSNSKEKNMTKRLTYKSGEIRDEEGNVVALITQVTASRKLRDRLGKLAVNQFNAEEYGKYLRKASERRSQQ